MCMCEDDKIISIMDDHDDADGDSEGEMMMMMMRGGGLLGGR